MNYAFMSFSCPEADLKTALKTAEDLGYSGFEPRVDSGHRHGIELTMDANARREVRAVARGKPGSALLFGDVCPVGRKIDPQAEHGRRPARH